VQLRQTETPEALEYVPATHCRQVVEAIVVYKPAVHTSQTDAPENAEKKPSVHALQKVAFGALL